MYRRLGVDDWDELAEYHETFHPLSSGETLVLAACAVYRTECTRLFEHRLCYQV